MMRNLKTLVIFLFSIVIFSSCKKENSPTQGQIMAAKLKGDIGGASITQVMVYDFVTGTNKDQGTAIVVNGDGTVNVTTAGTNPTNHLYSLETLVTYYISSNTLYLYF